MRGRSSPIQILKILHLLPKRRVVKNTNFGADLALFCEINDFYCRPPEAVSKRPLLLWLFFFSSFLVMTVPRNTLSCFAYILLISKASISVSLALRNLGRPSHATLLRSAVILQLFCLVQQKIGENHVTQPPGS